MNYRDQLVLTGALNDVGSSLRTNVPQSYRRGVEINLNTQYDKLHIGVSSTISSNKISSFNEIFRYESQ